MLEAWVTVAEAKADLLGALHPVQHRQRVQHVLLLQVLASEGGERLVGPDEVSAVPVEVRRLRKGGGRMRGGGGDTRGGLITGISQSLWPSRMDAVSDPRAATS